MQLPEHSVGLDALLGIEVVEASGERVELRCPLRPELHQPFGIVHGGLYCTMVETAASLAGQLWVGDRGLIVGVANHTNFLRATSEGVLAAVATPVHRGRSQQLWQVEVTDAAGRLVARGEVRLATLDRSGGLPRPGE